MDHLHVVAGTGLADPIAAGLAVDLSSGGLEDLIDVGPSRGRATGHGRGTVAGTLLTTGNTRADKQETLGLELLGATYRVGVVGVATINDDVALLEMGLELCDELVDSGTGLDEEDDLARTLELSAELLNGPGADDLGAFSKKGER